VKLATSKTFRHENKCSLCKKGELNHRSTDKACPLGSNFPQFVSGRTFVDSGKPTIRSSRQLKELIAQETRAAEAKAVHEREIKKNRALTLDEVVAETMKIILYATGLSCEIQLTRSSEVELHLTANYVRLGHTSVLKTMNGSYIVGGSSTGCFMANNSGRDISNVLKEKFFELEEKANKEKGV
jgi:hypothetical protein